jgi:hypothetical protein
MMHADRKRLDSVPAPAPAVGAGEPRVAPAVTVSSRAADVLSLPAGRFANVILASSFYHVILACMIARDPRFPGETLLVLNVRRAQVRSVFRHLATASDSPFSAVAALPEGTAKKPARERRYGNWLGALDARIRPERVFVFTDLTPHVQLLCRHAEARGARTFCAEDGGSAYSSRSWASRWRRHLQRMLRFGPWIQNIRASGTSRHVQTYLAMHPELVRPELRAKPVWPLHAAWAPEVLASRWLARFLEDYDVAPQALVCDELYTPGNSRTFAAGERVHARLREEIRSACRAGRECIVKYHPHEQEDFLQAGELGARTLPPAVPAELVLLASGERLQRVVGIGGTSLLSARWLAPQARAVSLIDLADTRDPWYGRTLDRLGVERLK